MTSFLLITDDGPVQAEIEGPVVQALLSQIKQGATDIIYIPPVAEKQYTFFEILMERRLHPYNR